jgi:hypothetical protein
MRHLALILMCSLPLSACAYPGGPIAGSVLEEGTNKRIAGAIVVARWQGDAFSLVHTQTVCLHVELATTDRQGRFRIPGWRKDTEPKGVRNLTSILTVYKAGYEVVGPASEPGIFYLTPFAGTKADRLERLERVEYITRCSNAAESEKNLLRCTVHCMKSQKVWPRQKRIRKFPMVFFLTSKPSSLAVKSV